MVTLAVVHGEYVINFDDYLIFTEKESKGAKELERLLEKKRKKYKNDIEMRTLFTQTCRVLFAEHHVNNNYEIARIYHFAYILNDNDIIDNASDVDRKKYCNIVYGYDVKY
jgi:hypothetical protein